MAQYGPKMALGCPIKNIEKPLVFIVFLRFQGVLGGSLGVLGGSGVVLGWSWEVLGWSWGGPGVVLGWSWEVLGWSWGGLGVVLGALGRQGGQDCPKMTKMAPRRPKNAWPTFLGLGPTWGALKTYFFWWP